MMLEKRLESLKKKHAEIDHFLHEEEIRPSADTLVMQSLKQQKLFLKDEMSRLTQNQSAVA